MTTDFISIHINFENIFSQLTKYQRFIFWQNKMKNTRIIKYLKVLKIIHNGCDHLPKLRLSIEKIKL